MSLFPLDGNGDVQAFHTTGTGGNLPQLLALNPARTRLDLTNFSTSPNGTVAAFGLDANGDIQSGPTNTVMPAGAGNPYGVAVR